MGRRIATAASVVAVAAGGFLIALHDAFREAAVTVALVALLVGSYATRRWAHRHLIDDPRRSRSR